MSYEIINEQLMELFSIEASDPKSREFDSREIFDKEAKMQI
jgi:hypothetical protein